MRFALASLIALALGGCTLALNGTGDSSVPDGLDASRPDAGPPVGIDAGPVPPGVDAGDGVDAGPAPVDGGPPVGVDAGPPIVGMDAGPPVPDAGPPAADAGPPDAGALSIPYCPGVPLCSSYSNCTNCSCNSSRCGMSCASGSNCGGNCNNGADCGTDASGASDANFDCNNRSSCLYWGPASNLIVDVNNNSSAEVYCRGSSNCRVDCRDGDCLVDCSGTALGNCQRNSCGTWTPCGGNVFVCRRSCPP